MADDPRVEKLVAEYRRMVNDPQEIADTDVLVAATAAIAVFERAGLAVVLKDETGPDEWGIGDPPPPDDVIAVYDSHSDDGEGNDVDLWGRTRSGWKGYKNGFKVYVDWAELVRRWGPVRRG